MTHYVCTGSCHGVSDTPKVCGTEDCTKFQQSLTPCDCVDGKHEHKAPQK